jgi:hypothetical protein
MQRMAELEVERVREEEQSKKERIESFMNSTRVNANRLYREQCTKNMQQINCKKELLGKQKELKAKYTLLPKKTEKQDAMEVVCKLPREPVHVNWKQAEDAFKKMQPQPVENCEDEDSGCESGFDSDVDKEVN